MDILRTKRHSGRTVYHEWDYTLQDSKVFTVSDIELVNTKSNSVERIWLKPNLSIGKTKSIVNYFFNNYEIDSAGTIINIDMFSDYYLRQKQATLRNDLYYVNLERVYEYETSKGTRYAYYKQQYPVAMLVALNFLHNPNTGRFKYIEFLDKNRRNHDLSNLSWVDKKSKNTLKILK